MSWKRVVWSVHGALFLLCVVDGFLSVGALPFYVRATGSISSANFLEAVFWLSLTIAELPTGALSDRWGPKKSLLVAGAVRCLAFLLFFTGSSSMPTLFFASALAGVAVTLMTGMFQAQIKLLAARTGESPDFHFVSSNSSFLQSAGLFTGALLGYGIMSITVVEWIWLGALGAGILQLVYIFFFWERLCAWKGDSLIQPLLQAGREAAIHPQIRSVMLGNFFFVLAGVSLTNNWPVVFVPELDQTPAKLVLYILAITFLRMIFSIFWGRIRESRMPSLSMLFVAFAGAMALSGTTFPWLAYPGLLLAIGFACGCEIVIRKRLLELLPSGQAGSLLSIHNLFENAAGAAGLFVLGWLLKSYTVRSSWALSAGMLASVAIIMSFQTIRKPKVTNEPPTD
jgi:MFS family permease